MGDMCYHAVNVRFATLPKLEWSRKHIPFDRTVDFHRAQSEFSALLGGEKQQQQDEQHMGQQQYPLKDYCWFQDINTTTATLHPEL